MVKLNLKSALLLLFAILWFVLLSQLTVDAQFIGDIKLWASLLGVCMGLSVWARLSQQSHAIQDAYDRFSYLIFFYALGYGALRLGAYLALDSFLGISSSGASVVLLVLMLPHLIWKIMNSHAMPLLLAHGKIPQAKRYLATRQRFSPANIDLAMQKINLARQEHDEDAVLAEMSRVIALYPSLVGMPFNNARQTIQFQSLIEIYYQRLFLHFRRADNDITLMRSQALTRVNHMPDVSRIARGVAFLLLNDLDAAAIDLEYGIRISNQPHRKVPARIVLGLVEYVANNDEQAEEHWDQALWECKELMPYDNHLYSAQIYVYRGWMAFHRGDAIKAWQFYEKAFRSDRRSIEARAGMAVLHAANDHWDRALTIWRKLQAERPYFADPDEVIRRHFRWTPPMAEGVRQITTRLNSVQTDTLVESIEEPRQSLLASR